MKGNRTFTMVLTSIFIAIIILQSFVPFLGNLPLFVLDITIIHITIIIGGILMGEKIGAFLGLVWGLCSFIRAFTAGSAVSLMVFTNPLISILPRVVVGYLAALLYRKLSEASLNSKFAMGASGLVGSLLNTILVLGLIYLLLGNKYAQAVGVSVGTLPTLLMGVVLTNGIAEAIAAAVITPIVGTVLMKLQMSRH